MIRIGIRNAAPVQSTSISENPHDRSPSRAACIALPPPSPPPCPPSAAEELTLYTTREPGLIQPLIAAFTAQTRIKVNTVFVKDGLLERVKAEGARSPADVLMTVDIGNLIDLVDGGVTQPVKSAALESADSGQPARRRRPVVRAVAARPRAVRRQGPAARPASATKTWPTRKYKGKVCIRAGQHPYNTALVAAHDRARRRGQDRAVAARRQGQPGAQGHRRRPRRGARHPRRHLRHRPGQLLLRRPDEGRRTKAPTRASGAMRSRSFARPSPTRERRHARQHQRRGASRRTRRTAPTRSSCWSSWCRSRRRRSTPRPTTNTRCARASRSTRSSARPSAS